MKDLKPGVQTAEFRCFVSPASDWRFWLRIVLLRQWTGIAVYLAGVVFSLHAIWGFILVVSCSPVSQRIRVDAQGIGLRWLFLRKVVPKASIVEARFSCPRGILNSQTLQVKVEGRPDLEIRASRSVLRILGNELSRIHGHDPAGVIHEHANRGAIWVTFGLPSLLISLGLLIGFVVFLPK